VSSSSLEEQQKADESISDKEVVSTNNQLNSKLIIGSSEVIKIPRIKTLHLKNSLDIDSKRPSSQKLDPINEGEEL